MSAPSAASAHTRSPSESTLPASASELNSFFGVLSCAPHHIVLLSTVMPFCDSFCVPSASEQHHQPSPPCLPPSLDTLSWPLYSSITYAELLTMSETVADTGICVSAAEKQQVECCTRERHKSEMWHKQRVGRLTASMFHTAFHLNVNKPLVSFVKKSVLLTL